MGCCVPSVNHRCAWITLQSSVYSSKNIHERSGADAADDQGMNMNDALRALDDLKVVAGPKDVPSGFVLTGLVHNELHFLPVFLPHYRALGVERFVFIDDQSHDGTSEFLAAQDDVTVLNSNRRFGDHISDELAAELGTPHNRMDLVWRMLLLEKFGLQKWSLHLDADEFLDLPDGMQFQDFARLLDAEQSELVWACMLDMYPRQHSGLRDMQDDIVVDFARDWYFDGRQHLRLRTSAVPKKIYGGCRARLLNHHGLHRKAHWFQKVVCARLGMDPPFYNAFHKPVMLKWSAGTTFISSHRVDLPASDRFLLPLRHYKFNGSVCKRIAIVLATGGHPNGSLEYRDLAALLEKMALHDDPFLHATSVKFTNFDDFKRTGNALGFD